MVAKALRRPFYVAVESYKFARMYPLTQRDIFDMCDASAGPASSSCAPCSPTVEPSVSYSHSAIDFTPSEFISLLFTDLGVLTPAAVSDELIRLYQ